MFIRSFPLNAVTQYLLIAVWILFRQCCDVIVWAHIIYNLPNGFLSGPILPMLFVCLGTIMLSVYLNPWWLQLKFLQVNTEGQWRYPESYLILFSSSLTDQAAE